MSRARKVVLELLRHGPAHNQLLSPLTQYLALCGNHHSETVHVPYEHNEFLARHDSLMYSQERRAAPGTEKTNRNNRELQLQITAREMSSILTRIPGLISELRPTGRTDDFTHFELVLSASELSMLPFELRLRKGGNALCT